MTYISPCKNCGSEAKLLDERVECFVICTNCETSIKGASLRHLDHIALKCTTDEECDRVTEQIFDSVDWGAIRKSAIDIWNAFNSPREA